MSKDAKLQPHPALAYAARGWHVLPLHSMRGGICSCSQVCKSPAKHPRTENGLKDASADPDIIQRWLEAWPDMNVGIATGPSNLLVLDVDPKHGGEASLEALLKRLGDGIMESVRVKTGGGGLHVYYQGHNNLGNSAGTSTAGLGPGLDTRGLGGYVVAPPSNHRSGGTYQWAAGRAPWEAPLQPLPAALALELQRPRVAPVLDTPAQPIVSGGRNQTLASLAGSLQRKGLTTDAIAAALKAHNRAVCKPPLGDREVEQIVASIARYPKGPQPDTLIEAALTDLGNGKRLVATFGDLFRYVHEWGWMLWEGRHWTRDTKGGMEDFAKKTVHITQAAAIGIMDDEARKRLLKHADRSQSWGAITRMISMARSEPGIDKPVDAFDTHDGHLNLRNCVLVLATGEMLPHDPELYLTGFIDIEYDSAARCPRWEKFLEECCLGDTELMAYLQRAVGYTLTGYTREEVLFFLFGDGENGKSKFIETIRMLLGDLAGALGFNTLLSGRDSKPQNALAGMRGKRMATAVEAGEGRSLDEEVIKQITGQDTISVEQKYKDAFDMKPKFKLWMASNYKPAVRGVDGGIWRRLHLIPFQNSLKPGQRDPHLLEKLRAELPGILAWAVRGAVEWHRQGLNPPKKILAAVEEYREDNNVVGRWIDERCTLHPDLETPASELLQAINAWLVDMHEKELTQTALGRRLAKFRAGLLSRGKNGKGLIVWRGIALGRDVPPPAQRSLEAALAPPPPSELARVLQQDPKWLSPDGRQMPKAYQDVLAIVRELAGAAAVGYVSEVLVEQTAALKGHLPSEVQRCLRWLQERGMIYQKGGGGRFAPMEA